MSFLDNVEKAVNLPVVLQVAGFAVLGITFWKGVHGVIPSFGFIAGTAMVYVGKHYYKIYSPTPKS